LFKRNYNSISDVDAEVHIFLIYGKAESKVKKAQPLFKRN
jgi:hypothetical protein